MERVRESLASTPMGPGTLVRVVEITGIGVREGTDGAVVLPGESTPRGSVLGGVIDHLLVTEGAETAGRRTTLEVPVSDPDAIAAGLLCGGTATLLLSPLTDLPDITPALWADAEPLVLVAEADGSGGDLAVSTGSVAGSLWNDTSTDTAVRRARQILRSGLSGAEIDEIEGRRVVFSAAVPTTRAMIVGEGPMAEAFARQGELMGWHVSFVADLATAEEFLASATPADAVLMLSHDPDLDVPVLAAATRSAVGYIGAMGARHTQSRRARQLEELGHTDRSRIHGPLGLDLGSRTPAETAVAMAAEFLAVRRGRPPRSLSTHDGPIHA